MHTNTPSPIQLDESPSIIVVQCAEHPWWAAARFHRDEAYEAACAHEERDHPGDYRQRRAAHMRASRRVATSREAKRETSAGVSRP